MACQSEIVMERGSLAVLRCACGALNLRVGHTSLGFDEKSFVALASLIADALPELRTMNEPTRKPALS